MFVRGVDAWGLEATIVHAYHTAAVCKSWRVTKAEHGNCVLTADLVRSNTIYLRRRPLLFVAPRKGGHWCWPIRGITQLSEKTMMATLGPMEG